MKVIAHISDTHFGTEVQQVIVALKAKLEQIKPNVTILSGDITQRALPSEFVAAKKFFDELSGELKIAIPGNHDIPLYNLLKRFTHPYKNYLAAFEHRENIWMDEHVAIIACDTTSPYRHTQGKMDNDLLRQKLDKVRAQAKNNQLLVVVAHQPLLTALSEDRNEVLINAQATAKILSDYKVDAVLSGHVHFPLITTSHDGFTLEKHFALLGAGTAVSSRTRSGAPNSFNVISLKSQEQFEVIKYELKNGVFVANIPIEFGRNHETGWLKI